MNIIPKRYQSFVAGILFATGSWIIVIGLREELLKTFATTNQYVIGMALIFVAWLVGKK